MSGDFMKAARLESNVGFTGTNKILNILEIRRDEKEIAILYPKNSSEISPKAAGDFWKQWKERIGSNPKIVNK